MNGAWHTFCTFTAHHKRNPFIKSSETKSMIKVFFARDHGWFSSPVIRTRAPAIM